MVSKGSAVIVMTVVAVSLLVSEAFAGRQFVPSGRYGRRSDIPPLTGVQQPPAGSSSLLEVRFFGDSTVQCTYTGLANYYRCSRRGSSSTEVEPPFPAE